MVYEHRVGFKRGTRIFTYLFSAGTKDVSQTVRGPQSVSQRPLRALAVTPGRMLHLAHTAHLQFLGLITGFLAWILIMATAGLNEWRLWHVEDESVITSGVAWVGIWRACFYSQVLPKTENCWSISITDSFAPAEIPVAQVLMMLAVICGLAANIIAALAVRLVYFSVEDRKHIRLVFVMAGTLYLLTGTSCLVPLAWNMTSVLKNNTIDFPPEFHLPSAPTSQRVGTAIGVGLLASIMILISALLFLCYRYSWKTLSSEAPIHTKVPLHRLSPEMTQANPKSPGMDNPSFYCEEAS